MSPRLPLRTPAAEIARARHIVEVLIRNGLGFLVERLGLSRFAPRRRASRDEEVSRSDKLSVPQRVRHTIEELGPTYIKLGQILSTRPDLLPPGYVVELSKLLDSAPPVDFAEISATMERELGTDATSQFAEIDPEPVASASIGQVHEAVLLDGTPVVVKVQRPSIEGTITADLNLLRAQARLFESASEALRHYHLLDLVNEFGHALLDELDYTAEGHNADALREIVSDQEVVIPRVFWELSTQRVITLERLEGTTLANTDALRSQGYDLERIAERIVHIYLDLVFRRGVFHADPHPANIMVCGDRIGLIDFGVMGYLTPQARERLGDLLLALTQQDADEIVYIIMRIGALDEAIDRQGLRREVQRLIVRYYDASLENLQIAKFLGDIMGIAFRYRVRLPADLALLARTVIILEGVALGLDPSFVLAKHLEPFVIELVKERFAFRRMAIASANTLRELVTLSHALPRRMDVLTQQLQDGNMVVGIDVRHLSQALRKLDAIGNRLSFSVIVAAIVVGSALVVSAGNTAASFVIPFTNIALPIAQVGFVLAGLLGAWLLFSILRSKGL